MAKCSHEYSESEASGWFSLEHGRRVEHTVFCTKCGMRLDIQLDTKKVVERPDKPGVTPKAAS